MIISENVVVVGDNIPAPESLQPRLPRPPGPDTFPDKLSAWWISRPAGRYIQAVSAQTMEKFRARLSHETASGPSHLGDGPRGKTGPEEPVVSF